MSLLIYGMTAAMSDGGSLLQLLRIVKIYFCFTRVFGNKE